MNKVYFIRHAKPDFSIHDDFARPLTEEGILDCIKITDYFKDQKVAKIYSSPYKRSVDTISDIARFHNLSIELIEDFRERKVSTGWIEDFDGFAKQQWQDFDYKLAEGESLREVQSRNIAALHEILSHHHNETIVIGTHGTALSTILNYYDPSFTYEAFEKVKHVMPWIACVVFDGYDILSVSHVYEF